MSPKKRTSSKTALTLAKTIAQLALDKKAENVLSLDLRGITSVTDFFIICSVDTDVQVKSIADHIRHNTDHKPWHIEGYENLNWIILDYIDVVVHIFRTEEREYYQLETLWADAPAVPYTDEPETLSTNTTL